MARLNIWEEKLFVACANPIFPTSDSDWRNRGNLIFEVLADDADSLRHCLGKIPRFSLDTEAPFWATLTNLDPCISTRTDLSLSRDKPTLHGSLVIVAPAESPRLNSLNWATSLTLTTIFTSQISAKRPPQNTGFELPAQQLLVLLCSRCNKGSNRSHTLSVAVT